MEKHIFALYKNKLSHLSKQTKENEVFSSKDATLWNRLVKIVRIKENDHFILFDENIHITLSCTCRMLKKKRMIIGTVVEKNENKKIEPPLTLYLPILKKEAFEYVAYVAAQMGVNTIVPVVTKKSETKISTDPDRIKNIFIAACEQSKNFVPPVLCKPIPLEDIQSENLILFSEHGAPLHKCMNKISAIKTYSIIVGPEGGFSKDEEKFLREMSLVECALTPTILRSREAIALGIGIARSLSGRRSP